MSKHRTPTPPKTTSNKEAFRSSSTRPGEKLYKDFKPASKDNPTKHKAPLAPTRVSSGRGRARNH